MVTIPVTESSLGEMHKTISTNATWQIKETGVRNHRNEEHIVILKTPAMIAERNSQEKTVRKNSHIEAKNMCSCY